MNTEQTSRDLAGLILQAKDYFLNHIPAILSAILVLIIGVFIAWLTKKLIIRLMKALPARFSSDLLPAKITHSHLEQSARFLGGFVYWIIVLLFITVATEMLGLAIVTSWLGGVIKYLPNILFAIFSIYMGVFGGRLLGDIVRSAASKAGVLHGEALGRLVKYATVLVTALIAINQVGVDIAMLINLINIVLGAALFGGALAFGLGARVSVSNILAAYYLKSLYREGQQVKINDIEGRIIQLTPTSVLLETKEGQVAIPAKEFSEKASTLRLTKEENHEK